MRCHHTSVFSTFSLSFILSAVGEVQSMILLCRLTDKMVLFIRQMAIWVSIFRLFFFQFHLWYFSYDFSYEFWKFGMLLSDLLTTDVIKAMNTTVRFFAHELWIWNKYYGRLQSCAVWSAKMFSIIECDGVKWWKDPLSFLSTTSGQDLPPNHSNAFDPLTSHEIDPVSLHIAYCVAVSIQIDCRNSTR